MKNNHFKNLSLPLISVLGFALAGCGGSGITALDNKANPAHVQPIASSTAASLAADPMLPAAVLQVSSGTEKNATAGSATSQEPGARPIASSTVNSVPGNSVAAVAHPVSSGAKSSAAVGDHAVSEAPGAHPVTSTTANNAQPKVNPIISSPGT